MRDQFRAFYGLKAADFRPLWENATFIFDTNVLLNLYRYQSQTTSSLMKIMERVSDRIWIPFHVGLEFQRNRLTVIADQHRKFRDVEQVIVEYRNGLESRLHGLQLKKRHSHINPDNLLNELSKISDNFIKELHELEATSTSVSSHDKIRDSLDILFGDKVGSPPKCQKSLDAIYSEGEVRYQHQIPPGFKDSKKETSETSTFSFGGLVYQKKFSDFLIWRQILAFANEQAVKNIIFVTDDRKSDWWWTVDSQGEKTIGPRPELVSEIAQKSPVERFHIYSTESFLTHSVDYLDTKVSRETIEEVRDVSQRNAGGYRDFMAFVKTVEASVRGWLEDRYNRVFENLRGFPDFVCIQDGAKIGFTTRPVRDARMIFHRLDQVLYQSFHALTKLDFDQINIVVVCFDPEEVSHVAARIKRYLIKKERTGLGNIGFTIGTLDYQDDGQAKFSPATDFSLLEEQFALFEDG